jgi:hypothetical protein
MTQPNSFFKLTLSVLFFLLITSASAQDKWTQGKKGIYSAGIGGTQVIYVDGAYSSIANMGMSLNFSGEYKVYKFIGAGFQTGLNFSWIYLGRGVSSYNSGVGIGIPVSGKVNVHLMDAFNARIADDLDIYAGINVGGGPVILAGDGVGVGGFVVVGPQVGVRYWFDRVGIFGEFGYGATFANVGISF